MKKVIREIFSDNAGTLSSMRVMSVFALFVAAALALLPLFYSDAKEAGSNLHVLYFLTAAFAPKAIQKFAEKKGPD